MHLLEVVGQFQAGLLHHLPPPGLLPRLAEIEGPTGKSVAAWQPPPQPANMVQLKVVVMIGARGGRV